MHTCIHTYIRTYVHTYMHTYIHTYSHAYNTYIHTYVGADVGVTSKLALFTSGTSVVCVEPHPVSFAALQRNLSGYDDRVVLFNFAVSDTVGPAPFVPPPRNAGQARAHLFRVPLREQATRASIYCRLRAHARPHRLP